MAAEVKRVTAFRCSCGSASIPAKSSLARSARALGYTAVGEHVGMAQRMESVAPPGGVMVSESTARLVQDVAVLGDPETVRIKGADQLVPAWRLLSMAVNANTLRRQRPDDWSAAAGS